MRTPAPVLSAVLVLIASTAAAVAQVRPNTAGLPCASARGLVEAHGAIVLGTGPTTYDRYVNARNFCTIDQVLMPAFVRSGDNAECFVGYTCEDRETRDLH